MPYYLCKKDVDNKGRHEVHTRDCSFKPSVSNSVDFGYFSNCQEAIKAMKSANPNHEFDGCYYCSNACHKG